MIETAMIFALGFLAASLAALLVLPVLNRRAARLARRRIEGLFPTSMQEIAAERDALRAEFAVAQVRLERRVEDARNKAVADRTAAGARIVEIAALERAVEGRDASLAAGKAEFDEALAHIVGLDRDLAAARGEAAAGLAALTALEEAHEEILDDLKSVRRDRDGLRQDLDGARAQAEAPVPPPSEPASPADESAEADLPMRHRALAAERDELRASLTAAEDALARAVSERRAGREQERDDAELRTRIAEIAEVLTRRERLPAAGTLPQPASGAP